MPDYTAQERLSRFLERLESGLARRVPANIAYWVYIHKTNDYYFSSGEEMPNIRAVDVLKHMPRN